MSHNPYIVWNDLSTFTFTATGGTVTGYELANLNDYSPTTYWSSSVASSGPASNYLNVSFATQSIDTFVVGGINNIYSAYSNHKVPVYYKTALGVDTLMGYLTASADNDSMVMHANAPVTTHYMFLDISSNTTNVKIANIFAGQAVTFSTPYDKGAKIANTQYNTSAYTMLDGSTVTSQIYAGRQVYELVFSLQDTALKTAFQAFVRGVRGALNPFFFVDFDDSIYYMHIEDYVPLSTVHYGYHNLESLIMKTHEAAY